MKYRMDAVELIQCLGFWNYMGLWVGISTRKNWWLTTDPNMSEGAPFRMNNYMSRKRFEVTLLSIFMTIYSISNIIMCYSACIKWKGCVTKTFLNNLIWNVLIYWTKL